MTDAVMGDARLHSGRSGGTVAGAGVFGAALAAAAMVAAGDPARAAPVPSRPAEECFSAADARNLVRQKVVAPLGQAVRRPRGGTRVLRAALCARDGQYYYRLTLLRRDGKVVRHFVPARPARADAGRQAK
ncbi:hypothetical protein ACFFJB_05485 [Camelimonas abortus]|uniref:PepSY domain-containing protein n=1 Tax=Camelimonas abortus TaxID=1017184 RepID=A0ABV7LHF6_9HYPH